MENAIMEVEKRGKVMPVWLRIVVVLLLFIVISAIIQFIALLIYMGVNPTVNPLKLDSTFAMNLSSVSMVITSVVVVWFMRTKVDKKSFESLGFRNQGIAKNVAYSFVVVLLIMVIGTLILSLTKSISFSWNGFDWKYQLMNLYIFILVGFYEELLFRGYILNNLMNKMNKYLALSVTAVLFSLMHILNSGIGVLPVINLFIAGLFLGAAYIFTKSLWFAIGLHIFWNFIQGPILGYRVSGEELSSVFSVVLRRNSVMNGGDFGFEGSIVCTVLTLLATGFILLFYSKKQNEKEKLTCLPQNMKI